MVTGAAGFVGSHFARFAASHGHAVVAVDNLNSHLYAADIKTGNLATFRDLPSITFMGASIQDREVIEKVKECDAVANFAAAAGLAPSWVSPQFYSENNVTAVAALLSGLPRDGSTNFVQISTSSVYGRSNAAASPSLDPISPYGVTKLAAEDLCRVHSTAFGLPCTVVRLFSVYGPSQRPDMAYHRICTAILRKQTFQIFGDGHQVRANTYVSDLLPAILNACETPSPYATHDLSGGSQISLRDAVTTIEEALGEKCRVQFEPPQVGDQRSTQPSYQSAAETLNYSPITNIHDGLRLQALWHRSLTSP